MPSSALSHETTYIAFHVHTRIASGSLQDVAVTIRQQQDEGKEILPLVFEQTSGRQLDVDLGGTLQEVAQRYGGDVEAATGSAPLRRGRGRPRLGVVGREVTLLPRHWEWLESQRGSPSAALRRLIDEARAAHAGRDRVRQAQDATNRFISAIAGDLPGFEEATRALYAGDRERFDLEIAGWPADVRQAVSGWSDLAFDEGGGASTEGNA